MIFIYCEAFCRNSINKDRMILSVIWTEMARLAESRLHFLTMGQRRL